MAQRNSLGPVDRDIDTPAAVQSQGSQAEAQALLRFALGIDFSVSNQQIAQTVAARICSIRGNLADQANLESDLQRNITDAVNLVAGSARAPTREQRERAVAQAVYNTVPTDWLIEYASKGIPVPVSIDNSSMSSVVRMGIINLNSVNYDIGIDTTYPFWRRQQFNTDADLVSALTGRTPEEIGMQDLSTPPLAFAVGYTITAADANTIVTHTFANISANESYGTDEKGIDVAGAPVTPIKLKVDLDKLLQTKLKPNVVVNVSGTNVDLGSRYIAELNEDQLGALLALQKNGHYPYWKLLVDAGGKLPTDKDTTFFPRDLLSYALEIIRNRTGATAGNPLGQKDRTIFEMQNQMHDRLKDQEKDLARLQKGSENGMGAVLAASMLSQNRGLRSSLGTKDKSEVQKKLNTAEDELIFVDNIELLEKMKMPSAEETWDVVRKKIHDIDTTTVTAGASFDIGVSTSNAETFTVGPTVRDVDHVKNQLRDRKKQLQKEVAEYDAIFSRMLVIYNTAPGGKCPPVLTDFFDTSTTPPGRDRIKFDRGTDLRKIATELKRFFALKQKSEVEAEVEKYRKEMTEMNAGKLVGLEGDDAQRAIFKAFLKQNNPGISEANADMGASYLFNRTILDQDHQEVLRESINSMHEDAEEVWYHASFYRDVVKNIATACNISHRFDPVSQGWTPQIRKPEAKVNWHTAKYPDLVTAYFALKRLSDGEGPAYLNGNNTIYADNMKEIANILASHPGFNRALRDDYFKGLSEEDKKAFAAEGRSMKMTSAELMDAFLKGEPPEKYKNRISKILERTDARTNWKSRKLWSGTKATFGALKTAVGWTLGKGKDAASWTAQNTVARPVKWAARNWVGIAAFGFGTAVTGGNPLGGALFLYGVKMFGKPAPAH